MFFPPREQKKVSDTFHRVWDVCWVLHIKDVVKGKQCTNSFNFCGDAGHGFQAINENTKFILLDLDDRCQHTYVLQQSKQITFNHIYVIIYIWFVNKQSGLPVTASYRYFLSLTDLFKQKRESYTYGAWSYILPGGIMGVANLCAKSTN